MLGGGGLLAAFPLAYAVSMSALYAPLVAMLLALVFRGVAFEFRWRDPGHRAFWDHAFTGGSFVAAFMQGIMLGALLQGVQVEGRAELYELKGELGLRASRIERVGLGGHLVALERLKRQLAAEGLFASERKRRLPRVPRAVGILTGADAAARGDLIATIGRRFPAAKVVVSTPK